MDEFDWNTQNECYLLESMCGHKPIGVNKAFQMLCIYDKFKERVEKEVLSHVIWRHLGTMYNLEALDDTESLPFPNNESEFELPELEYADLKESKIVQNDDVTKIEESLTHSNLKEITKQDEKILLNIIKEAQRRDSKDSRSSSTSSKKDKEIVKKENDKSNKNKGSVKGDVPKNNKIKDGEISGKTTKRPTRGSLKADDSSSSGKSSPITVTPTPGKKRRVK